ncbi:MAG TPA: hypothetical protein VIQ97_01870 [Prevotella sp.]
MKQVSHIFKSRLRLLVIAAGTLLVVMAWMAWRCRPLTARQIVAATVVTERLSWYELCANGKPVLFFNAEGNDTLLNQLSPTPASAVHKATATGHWSDRHWFVPSCRGRLFTAFPTGDTVTMPHVERRLSAEKTKLKRLMRGLRMQDAELNYFLRVHGVQDEGYAMVADYEQKIKLRLQRMGRILTVIDSVEKAKCRLSLRHRVRYNVYFRQPDGTTAKLPCTEVGVSADNGMCLLQTTNHRMPATAYALRWLPWASPHEGKVLVSAIAGVQQSLFTQKAVQPVLLPATKKGNECMLSAVLASGGSPVFSPRGWFIGSLLNGRVVNRSDLSDLYNKE